MAVSEKVMGYSRAEALAKAEEQARLTLANRPARRATYEKMLRSSGLKAPDPITIEIPDDLRLPGIYYSRINEGPIVRGARITGIRTKDHTSPTGMRYRDISLFTEDNIKPPFIDTIIRGVPLLFDWNGGGGGRGKHEWNVRTLTAEEIHQIRTNERDTPVIKISEEVTATIKMKTVTPKSEPKSEERSLLAIMRTWTGRRTRKGKPWLRDLRKVARVTITRSQRNRLWSIITNEDK